MPPRCPVCWEKALAASVLLSMQTCASAGPGGKGGGILTLQPQLSSSRACPPTVGPLAARAGLCPLGRDWPCWLEAQHEGFPWGFVRLEAAIPRGGGGEAPFLPLLLTWPHLPVGTVISDPSKMLLELWGGGSVTAVVSEHRGPHAHLVPHATLPATRGPSGPELPILLAAALGPPGEMEKMSIGFGVCFHPWEPSVSDPQNRGLDGWGEIE